MILLVELLLLSPSIMAECAPPPENPFEYAESVFLAQVIKDNPDQRGIFKAEGQIKVLKIYKAEDIEQVKQFSSMTYYDLNEPANPLKERANFLFYDYPNIGYCTYGSRMVDKTFMFTFEKYHTPIWIAPDI